MTAGLKCRIGAALASLLSLAAFTAPALAVGDVVISQVWGGNGVNASVPNCDYVELFNRTGAPVSLSGWSVSVASSGTSTTWAKLDFAPTAVVQPFSYYLVRVTATSATGTALPGEDAVFSPASTVLASTTGKVALRNVTTAIGAVCNPTGANLIDLVTYGTTVTTCREGAGNAPAGNTTNNTTATRRVGGCVDTDDNFADFESATTNPRWSGSPAQSGCVSGACCNNTSGVCSIASSGGCANSGGTYQGDGTTCTPNPCPANGACCNGTTGGTCTILTPASCTGISGFYQGDGSLCSPTPCVTTACCLPANLTCCALFPALCTSQGGTPSATGVTCTTAGNCIAQPVNDLCSAAVVISAGPTSIGNNFAATSTGDGVSLPTETSRSTKGVWFRFTPATTSVFDVSACGSTFDTMLQIFSIGNCSDTATWSYVAGDDDDCNAGTNDGECGTSSSAAGSVVAGVALIGGQTYHIRLGIFGTSATGGGNYRLTVSDVGGAFGACCIPGTGQCELRSATGCAANGDGTTFVGVYQGDSTTCSPSPCTLVVGACCFAGGVCAPREASACTGTNVYNGDNTTCFPDPCNTEACCNNTSGVCTSRTLGTCLATETGSGLNSVCVPSPCPAAGACCNTDCTFACTTTIQTACISPSVWNSGSTCSPTNICSTFAPTPANDQPCGAIALTLGSSATGVVAGASTTNDGPDSTCQAASGRGVWYTFQPTTTGYHSISTCGSTFDDVLSVMTGLCSDPANMVVVACDDDTCTGGATDPVICGTATSSTLAAIIPAVFLESTTNYFVRVQALSSTTVGGTFPLVVNTVSAGACCSSAGVCSVQRLIDCTGTETYQGDNTTCTSNPCPPAGSCCNTCTFACTTTLQSTCDVGTSVWTQGGTCTAPSTCIQTPAPANDLPCGAITLNQSASQSGTLFSATSTGDGLNSTCEATASKGVWYQFIPATSGDYTISTCGSTFATALTILTGDCANPDAMTQLQCDDDTCVGGTGGEPVVCGTATSSTLAAIVPLVNLAAGTTYYIRIQVDTATATGAGTFSIVVLPATSGACCTAAGGCTETIQTLCTGTSVWLSGQLCSANPCPATGACCDNCGTCTVAFATNCTTGYQGNGTTCTVGICTSSGTPPNDVCANAFVISTFPYTDTQCTHNATPDGPPGSCDSFGQVTVMLFSVWYKFTPTVSGTFTVGIDYITWQGNRFSTMHATPTPDCPTTTATEIQCGGTDPANYVINAVAGTTYWVCVGDEGTITTDEGGTYILTASFVPDVPPGVCCRGATCNSTITSSAACTSSLVGGQTAGAFFPTTSSTCNAAGVPNTPCCYADYNKVNGISVQDIFDFLADWFAGSPYANTGGNGSAGPLAVQNIFDFLSAWFAGGC